MNHEVAAVLVTYNSDLSRLKESLSVLVLQCRVVVVDNSNINKFQDIIEKLSFQAGAVYLSLGDNFGIAHAQNVGIAWARKNRATDILLIDDDTIPDCNFVMNLLNARNSLNLQYAVISSRTINNNGQDISNRLLKGSTDFTPCSELTSSGTLISMVIFDLVGIFDEKLFIDCVDFEWGWRASALGVPLLLCNNICIRHRLGEGERLGIKIASPIRHYYQYRNVLRMIFYSKAPLLWRLSQLIKLPIKLFFIAFFTNQRYVRLRYAFWGVCDFICGRYGKFKR
jgi:rhamnosyltransferase